MERADVERVLDVLADNFGEGWAYHREDDCHIYIKNEFAKKPPHIKLHKDNGLMTCLCGQFQVGNVPIGHQITAEEFIKIIGEQA